MPAAKYQAVQQPVKPYVLNSLRTKKMRDRYLVVNNYGRYADLSEQEYHQLQSHQLSDELLSQLEEKGIIITRANEDRVVADFRRKNSFLYQGTSLHIVVVTLRCNNVCVYCHAASKPESATGFDMDKATAKKTVDFIFQSPSNAITIEFQGGEPLLNFELVKYIVEYASKLNEKFKKDLRFSIVTNLTLMSDEILDHLIRENVGICTSLDPPGKMHDGNRKYAKGGGTYQDVVGWVRKLRDYPIHPHTLMVLTKPCFPYYKEIVDEHIRLGFKDLWLRWANNLGYAQESWKKLHYSPEEFVEFYRNAIDYIVKNRLRIREQLATVIVRKILTADDPNYLDLRSPCGAAIGQLAYDHDGSIYSCDEGRMVSGDIFKLGTVDQTYKEVMTSSETCSLIASSINDLHMCDSCVYKPYCGLCPVCSYASKGNLIPILSLDDRCKILKGIFDYIFEKLIFEEEYRMVFIKWTRKPNPDSRK